MQTTSLRNYQRKIVQLTAEDYLKYLKIKKLPNSTPLPECSPDEIMVERRTEFPFGRTFQPIVHEPEP